MTTHTHMWGPVQTGRWGGEPSRPCLNDCSVISLDLYLYCESCTGPLTVNERGEYHHIDETGAILPDFNAYCTPMPETGEAPYDEDDEDA